MTQQTFDRMITGTIAILLIVAALAVVIINQVTGHTGAQFPAWLQSTLSLVIGYYFGAHGRDLSSAPPAAP